MNLRGLFRSELSAWWRVGVLFIVMAGFAVLIIISVKAYKDSPPIPQKVVNVAGDTIFSGEDRQGLSLAPLREPACGSAAGRRMHCHPGNRSLDLLSGRSPWRFGRCPCRQNPGSSLAALHNLPNNHLV